LKYNINYIFVSHFQKNENICVDFQENVC